MKKAIMAVSCLVLLWGVDGYTSSGLSLEAGLTYNPMAKLEYLNGPAGNYEIVDNVIWESGLFYDFGSGFRSGAFLSLYKKAISPEGSTTSNLSLWGVGVTGDYGYEITESGHTLLVGGMEVGYSELTDRYRPGSQTAGSVWVGGFAGVRYYFVRSFSISFNYRLGWLEFDLPASSETGSPQKRYTFSGGTLKLSLAYSLRSGKQGRGQAKR